MVSATRVSAQARERLRSKAQVTPSAPTLSMLTMWLRVLRLLLPTLVHFDGDVDLDLCRSKDSMGILAEALTLPHLANVTFPNSCSLLHEEDGDGPGAYQIIQEVAVRSGPRNGAKAKEQAKVGSTVEVLETRSCSKQHCVWGRVATPDGWIMLLDTQTGL